MVDAVTSSAIAGLVVYDRDYPERTHRLDILRRVLDGSIYAGLLYRFDQERSGAGEYIPLRERQPSVRYPLARIVVEDSVALLFSEGHFPAIVCSDAVTCEALEAILHAARANAVMIEAARRGSVGSVAILLRVLRGRIFLDILDSLYLTPVWDSMAPDTLMSVTEAYKVSGVELLARGYDISDREAMYWFMRRWDCADEIWYLPRVVGGDAQPVVDEGRSAHHGLGFVPMVWVRNLPGGDQLDGDCTFAAGIETSVEIDYQLSQAGRGLKYSSDPTLLIREPAGFDGTMIRGAANALVVSEKGDAKLLEIGGSASEAVIAYVRTLREFALESMHGNRVDASRLAAPASGRALELMSQGLLWLADNLRVSYGHGCLLPLCRMILRASVVYPLRVDGVAVPPLDADAVISLRWPPWYAADALDRQRDAETVIRLVESRQMSRETAMRVLAPAYDIEDLAGERARLIAEAIA